MGTLSPLERELLTYVKQLTEASGHSNTVLSDLEKRSTGLLTQRLNDLEACLSELVSSQQQFNTALTGFLSEAESYTANATQLKQSETALMNARQRISR
ncbi:hypothetical protein GCM10007094_13060 [Pseudovibrio japonicus]|uniref:Uncharacterized protein n=1 Tax=Pseudovibrio japonicus TaxID=366534 RepID=A0ABQ3E543_9HYPH|nr:hypothetical protein [Pseudovibrio japonicus]GHB26263.1 hypothetical protein GCM10007094_13060 [Pseudovibrio japonicus]